jgi:8-hydroxy-5-deazaflavin:NADPH oxidoreductase
MKIGILGTGMVGNTLGRKLVQIGHEVTMGSRSANNEAAKKWAGSLGQRAHTATFRAAATFGEVVISCTGGMHSMEALQSVGTEPLNGKILIDVSNPLQVGEAGTMILGFCNTDSLGERIQSAFPATRVVKALNTVNCEIMIEPARVPGEHNLFICGNDAGAKQKVTNHLSEWFGWKPNNIIDLGDITAARGTEMMMPLWMRLFQGVIGRDRHRCLRRWRRRGSQAINRKLDICRRRADHRHRNDLPGSAKAIRPSERVNL